MSDAELLARVRAIIVELDQLTDAARLSSKYFTEARLWDARVAIASAEGSLVWHVEG